MICIILNYTFFLKKKEVLAIQGIGTRLADRIWEIVQTGDLKKLDYLKSRDDISSIELFTTVHGIGPTSAQNFVAQVSFLISFHLSFFCFLFSKIFF